MMDFFFAWAERRTRITEAAVRRLGKSPVPTEAAADDAADRVGGGVEDAGDGRVDAAGNAHGQGLRLQLVLRRERSAGQQTAGDRQSEAAGRPPRNRRILFVRKCAAIA